jgi:hypothetical protein
VRGLEPAVAAVHQDAKPDVLEGVARALVSTDDEGPAVDTEGQNAGEPFTEAAARHPVGALHQISPPRALVIGQEQVHRDVLLRRDAKPDDISWFGAELDVVHVGADLVAQHAEHRDPGLRRAPASVGIWPGRLEGCGVEGQAPHGHLAPAEAEPEDPLPTLVDARRRLDELLAHGVDDRRSLARTPERAMEVLHQDVAAVEPAGPELYGNRVVRMPRLPGLRVRER